MGSIAHGHVALDSPLGRVLHGARVGQQLVVQVDGAAVRYRVQGLQKGVLDAAAEREAVRVQRIGLPEEPTGQDTTGT